MYYGKLISQYIPRVLTQMDRDPDSPTFGCCDRNYWHLKIRDFPSAILQQSCLTLAMLYRYRFSEVDSCYYHNDNVYQWACGAIDYWCGIQLRDGSFNEYYPNEHGFPPTAFTLFAVSKACTVLDYMSPSIKYAIKKSVTHLINRKETGASNQEAAAIAGIYSANRHINNQYYQNAANKRLNEFLDTEVNEGWFIEHGGMDFGYLSVTLDMLGEIYLLTNQKRILDSMERCLSFCSQFIFPDKTIGGEIASRNTNYFLPAGVELLIRETDSKNASMIKCSLFGDYTHRSFIHSIDDRYLSHYVMHSFLRGALYEKTEIPEAAGSIKHEEDSCVYYRKAGFFLFRKRDGVVYISTRKGGVIRAFYKDKNLFNHYGYRINFRNKACITNWQSEAWQTEWDSSLNVLSIKGNMFAVKTHASNTVKHIVLRFLALVLGRRMIGFLKGRLIFPGKRIRVFFLRRISFEKTGVRLTDHFVNKTKRQYIIKKDPGYSKRLVASGKFFSHSELSMSKGEEYKLENELKIENFFKYFQIDGP